MKPTELGATFQIPKFEASAELILADQRHLTGKLFLTIVPASPLGHVSILDWFNQSIEFFPFLVNQNNHTEILNKRLIVAAIVDTKLIDNQAAKMPEKVWIEQIEVHCAPYLTVQGQIVLNLPPSHARVLDFLNQPEQFINVQQEDHSHIINKRYISSVKELPMLTAGNQSATKPMAKNPATRSRSRSK